MLQGVLTTYLNLEDVVRECPLALANIHKIMNLQTINMIVPLSRVDA